MKKSLPGKTRQEKTSRSTPLCEKAPPENIKIKPLDPPRGFGVEVFRSRTADAVPFLNDAVRRDRIEELISLLGSVDLEIDIPKSRRRP